MAQRIYHICDICGFEVEGTPNTPEGWSWAVMSPAGAVDEHGDTIPADTKLVCSRECLVLATKKSSGNMKSMKAVD